MSTLVIKLAMGVIALIILAAQVQLFKILKVLEEIRDR